jgi:hypothetical protein
MFADVVRIDAFFNNGNEAQSIAAATTATTTAEAPTSGPNLLNSHEEDYINSFFMSHAGQEMTGSSFEMAIQQAADQLHGANMMQFGWLMNEPPPNFMGASATPKPAPAQIQYQHIPQDVNFDFSSAFSDGSDMLGNNGHHNMLAQASMMQHNGMGHTQMQPPPPHTPSLVSGPSTEASDLIHTTQALSLPGLPVSASSLMINPPTTLNAHEVRDILSANSLHPLANLAPLDTVQGLHLDGPHTAPARLDEDAAGRLYRFGSDSHFGLDGFKPTSNHERHEFIAQRLTEELHMLQPINRSNVPTRASSPNHHLHQTGLEMGHSRKRHSTHMMDMMKREPFGEEDEDDHINRPKKRRKGSTDDDLNGPSSAKQRKFSVPNPRIRRVSSTAGEGSPTSKRRRSSISAASKAARENLSEEQKRSNHIQSEQKRRNLIKVGFDELRRIVPELRAGGLSKSMELTEVSNYLEQVIKANELFRQRMGMGPPG